jgi:NAD(P)-dependent dehydrogenase (short-subunit alcohol dehydrogenase family)
MSSSPALPSFADAPYDVEGKVVLVTGSNRGIGKAFVQEFVKAGAIKVYAAMRTWDDTIFADYGDRVSTLYIDMSKPESIEKAAVEAGDVQIVINNAGVLSSTHPLQNPEAIQNLQNEMTVNVYGFMHMAQQFAPVLERNGGGVLVQINSVASLRCSMPSASTYSASKAAAYSMTQALRHQLAAQNTRVMSVHPGPIATDMIAKLGLEHLAEPAEQVPQAVIEALKQPGVFHVYPDSKSQSLGKAYESYAKDIIEAGRMY